MPAPQVGIEAVLAAAPEAIVAGTDDAVRPQWLDEWRRWTDLPAVRRGNLLVVDANLLHRPGPRFVEGLEQLCTVLERARIKNRNFADLPAIVRGGALPLGSDRYSGAKTTTN